MSKRTALCIDVPRRSQVAGEAVIMENKLIRSQISGNWPVYFHADQRKQIQAKDHEAPCTLMPPDSILRMLYVSSEEQCYIVEQNKQNMRCLFTLVRPEYWLNGISPPNSLFCAFEFQTTNNNKTVLGLFDVLMLDNIKLTNLPIFQRVARVHQLLGGIPEPYKSTSNICFHFVGQQGCVLQHRAENMSNLRAFTPVQLSACETDAGVFELVPLNTAEHD